MLSDDDESTLEEIRSSFIIDGFRWSVETKKKLKCLWNKNVHMEEELRRTSIDFAESRAKWEMERTKFETIRADHTKQHKLHRKQIHDLRDKLSQFEASKNAKDDDNSNVSHQLKEALHEVSLMSLKLRKSARLAEETSLSLSGELSTANAQNDEISQKIEQLKREMAEEREETISVLEEQLQKQHEVESILDLTQQELNAQVEKGQALTENFEKEHELCKKLHGKMQMLELHQKSTVNLEEEFFRQNMREYEKNIETLERRNEALEIENQNLTKKNSLYETQVDENCSTIMELKKKLSKVLAVNEESNKYLQEEVQTLQQDNSTLTVSLESTSNRLETAISSIKGNNEQHQNEMGSMRSKLSVLGKEKEDLLNLLDEEYARRDEVRASLDNTVLQLQDELQSKSNEVNKAKLETQGAQIEYVDGLVQERNRLQDKVKALKLENTKVGRLLTEKEGLEETVSFLKDKNIRYKSTICKLQSKLDEFRIKYDDKMSRCKDQLHSTWSHFSKERDDLKFSLVGMKKQLRSARKKLDLECQWRDTSDGIHQQLLQEKSELIIKSAAVNEMLRDKSQEVMELKVRMGRLKQENSMLEDRIKTLVGHIHSTLTSLPGTCIVKKPAPMSPSGDGSNPLIDSLCHVGATVPLVPSNSSTTPSSLPLAPSSPILPHLSPLRPTTTPCRQNHYICCTN